MLGSAVGLTLRTAAMFVKLAREKALFREACSSAIVPNVSTTTGSKTSSLGVVLDDYQISHREDKTWVTSSVGFVKWLYGLSGCEGEVHVRDRPRLGSWLKVGRVVAVWVVTGVALQTLATSVRRWVGKPAKASVQVEHDAVCAVRVIPAAAGVAGAVDGHPACLGGRCNWSEDLVATLKVASALQPRTKELLASLNNKADAWARDNGVSRRCLAKIKPLSVAKAFELDPNEQLALEVLGGDSATEGMRRLTRRHLVAGTKNYSMLDVLFCKATISEWWYGTEKNILGD